MDDLQFARVEQLLTEIRDEMRELRRALIEPLPETPHTHEPADGSPASAPFWICKCGHVHDNERTD